MNLQRGCVEVCQLVSIDGLRSPFTQLLVVHVLVTPHALFPRNTYRRAWRRRGQASRLRCRSDVDTRCI